jgi:hypothetical protein
VEATGKGFVISVGLKGDLALFTVLVRICSRHSPRSRKAGAGMPAGIRYPRIAGAGVATCPLRIEGAGAGADIWR